MSIYEELLNAVDDGRSFKIDLINKSLWIGKRQVIKDGEFAVIWDKSKKLIDKWDLEDFGVNTEIDIAPWRLVEFLYSKYKHSVPKESNNKRSYFKALAVDELTEADLAYNIDRDLAQAMLEGYIFLASLQGWLKWEHEKHWFWQSENDAELVVLKNYIE